MLAALGVDVERRRVLDVGFGGGHLLRSFPESCELFGAEISESSVDSARRDPAYGRYLRAAFTLVPEGEPGRIPRGPFDIVLSSHTLEHVPDDRAVLAAIRERLVPRGLLCVFVPVEEPGYNPDHVRVYSVESIAERIGQAGFEVLFAEGSQHVNGHVWKILTVPSRRRWPILGPLVDVVRPALLSLLPYRGHRIADRALDWLGFGPRQAFVVAQAALG